MILPKCFRITYFCIIFTKMCRGLIFAFTSYWPRLNGLHSYSRPKTNWISVFYCSLPVMVNAAKFKYLDGLTTVQYKLHARIKQPLFTRIIVSFPGPTEPENAKIHFLKKKDQLEFLFDKYLWNCKRVMLWRENSCR